MIKPPAKYQNHLTCGQKKNLNVYDDDDDYNDVEDEATEIGFLLPQPV